MTGWDWLWVVLGTLAIWLVMMVPLWRWWNGRDPFGDWWSA
jgi:hypothetical protein